MTNEPLREDRSLLPFILLTIVTLGIYSIVVLCKLSREINEIASKHDGEKTRSFLLALLLAVPTLGIYPLVWYHNYSERVGEELQRREIGCKFGAGTFWLWCVLAVVLATILCTVISSGIDKESTTASLLNLLPSVATWVYYAKLLKATNLLNADYNQKGE